MPLSRLQSTLLASALALAGTAHAGSTLVSEGFDSVPTLASQGWVLTNNSTAGGTTGWFQGLDSQFPSQGGTNSYAAANFNNAPGGGTIDNWLISPEFSTATRGYVSVWLRGAADDGFADTVKFGFSSGGSDTSAFTTGALVTATGDWTQYTFAFAAGGAGSTGRFAIEYTGLADVSDYVGVDTLAIAAVPEPATWALFAFGLAGVAARRRSAR
jgi:hypothetical protein